MLLQNKSVVITGAGSGVGRAAALIFAQHGARVVCADIAADRLEEVVSEVRAANGTAEPAICDVRNENDLAAAIGLAVSAYGRLDVMFNNAGVASTPDGTNRALHECTTEDFERLSSVNFKGTFYGAKLAVRRFLDQGDRKGVIVNTASVAGMVGWGGVLYGSTKGAVIQMTRGLAIEVARHGIRVNAVCPAAMVTNFFRLPEGKSRAEIEASFGALHPLGRAIQPEDVANAALFLASDLAINITGVVLPVDGGYVAA
jgi:NAD(P)-dependent dehydrogenase (short-subunit alcohol dehydrogenase family)